MCWYSYTANCGHAIFACHESTLAVHSENLFMVSNLTTGFGTTENAAQILSVAKRNNFFLIWPSLYMHEESMKRKFIHTPDFTWSAHAMA